MLYKFDPEYTYVLENFQDLDFSLHIQSLSFYFQKLLKFLAWIS